MMDAPQVPTASPVVDASLMPEEFRMVAASLMPEEFRMVAASLMPEEFRMVGASLMPEEFKMVAASPMSPASQELMLPMCFSHHILLNFSKKKVAFFVVRIDIFCIFVAGNQDNKPLNTQIMKAKQFLSLLCKENLDLEKCSLDNGFYLNACFNFNHYFNEDVEYFYFYGEEDDFFPFLPDADLILKDPNSDDVVYFWIID